MAAKKSANRQARTPVVSLRLRDEIVERADEIARALARSGSHHRAARASGQVDRSYVLRWAIERGLDEIAREELDDGAGARDGSRR